MDLIKILFWINVAIVAFYGILLVVNGKYASRKYILNVSNVLVVTILLHSYVVARLAPVGPDTRLVLMFSTTILSLVMSLLPIVVWYLENKYKLILADNATKKMSENANPTWTYDDAGNRSGSCTCENLNRMTASLGRSLLLS